jgi:hypothetical protein
MSGFLNIDDKITLGAIMKAPAFLVSSIIEFVRFI